METFASLVEYSRDRYREAFYNSHVDDILMGAVIASMVEDDCSLIGVFSDGVNHHLRFEGNEQQTRYVFRLTHLSEDLTVARVQGHLGSVVVGYGEPVGNIATAWGKLEAANRPINEEGPEPGVIRFEADLASGFLYAQITLIMELDRFIHPDYHVDHETFHSNLWSVMAVLRDYLRATLREMGLSGGGARPASHARELRQSRGEILVGEIVAAAAQAGLSVVGISSDSDEQTVRLHAPSDFVLGRVAVSLRREPRRFGSRGGPPNILVEMQGEVRNHPTTLEELLEPFHPSSNEVVVERRHHTYSAVVAEVVPLEGGREALRDIFTKSLAALQDALTPFHRGRPAGPPSAAPRPPSAGRRI
ncbi:MAG: hypothetical protein FJX76_06625 [Armatimonadetes bacterium]|nr:hypothetical protein [Armatimonadota bacterium]